MITRSIPAVAVGAGRWATAGAARRGQRGEVSQFQTGSAGHTHPPSSSRSVAYYPVSHGRQFLRRAAPRVSSGSGTAGWRCRVRPPQRKSPVGEGGGRAFGQKMPGRTGVLPNPSLVHSAMPASVPSERRSVFAERFSLQVPGEGIRLRDRWQARAFLNGAHHHHARSHRSVSHGVEDGVVRVTRAPLRARQFSCIHRADHERRSGCCDIASASVLHVR